MSNFHFLATEFKPLYEPARGAEQLVYSDPRACCMRTRHALEQAVHWLYTHDRDLRMPYDNSLGVLLTQPAFERLLPPHVLTKARLIQKAGNQAVHGSHRIGDGDAMRLVRELFHVLFWLARTYTRASDPKSIEASWDERQVPRLVRADDAAALTRDELTKQEVAFQAQIQAQHAELERREASIAEQAATLAERESAIAALDAALAAAREALACAKATNLAVPDTHDYSEAETRRLFIDVLLREAGWEVGKTCSVEVPVTGMPNQPGDGFVDYVLWGADGKALAVVEAKRSMKDPDVGQQQAKLYADCLQKQTGQRPIIFTTNGHHTWLWDDQRAPPREVQGFYSREELALAIQRRSLQSDLGGLVVNQEIVERAYQHRAIRATTEAFASGRRRGLLTMATGTGKTRMAIALVDLLMRANWVKRVLFLADRVALVKQATNAFKAHLPDSSPVNLCTDKRGQGRVFLSTYPTMMGLIETFDGDARRYGVGHFDLIIVDEAHRSVYQKFGAIFRYFDSLLVGLTATPRDEVDRDTYHLFGLESGVPTDAYGLDEAVADGFLVPPRAQSVPIKFVREGIRYDQLSPEEKDHWESLDWGDLPDGAPDEVSASEVNKQLFNEDTVDLMLKHLMQHGLKVEGGDRLGKTILFAVNQRHAQFIAKRFDHHYPHLQGRFARVITHAVSYAQSLIDDFSTRDTDPHIAISVDMLDTGIDVPEVLNLVFFKAVRSKVKFLQMIGRGTRLCPDLLGPGEHKTEFAIFDFCGNFEYFNENPAGAAGTVAEPLAQQLFKRRLDLLEALPFVPQQASNLQDARPEYQGSSPLRADLLDLLHREVEAMNVDNFIVRPQRVFVLRFAQRPTWDALDGSALTDLRLHVAGLPSQREPEHITAKLFDLTCVNLQVALIETSSRFITLRNRVIELAQDLEAKESIPAVRAELELIQALQTEEWWKGVTLAIIEDLRRKLRGLIQFADPGTRAVVYTVLKDQIGEASEVTLTDFSTGINLAQYKRKVEAFIRKHADHVAIAKLRFNRPLTPSDLAELERFLFQADAAESRERFTECYGPETSLPRFIRSLVGLDRNAAKQAFARFLDGARYSSQQIRFVEMIIDRLTTNGTIDPGQLYEPPFTAVHHEGLDGVFADAEASELVALVERVGLAA